MVMSKCCGRHLCSFPLISLPFPASSGRAVPAPVRAHGDGKAAAIEWRRYSAPVTLLPVVVSYCCFSARKKAWLDEMRGNLMKYVPMDELGSFLVFIHSILTARFCRYEKGLFSNLSNCWKLAPFPNLTNSRPDLIRLRMLVCSITLIWISPDP